MEMKKIGFRLFTQVQVLSACLFTLVSLSPATPKLKWLYASSGIYLDRWGGSGQDGNGFGWIEKYNSSNTQQTLTSISIGSGFALTPKIGLNLSLPLFYNTFDEYTDKNDFTHLGAHQFGMGDLDIGVPIKIATATLQPQLSIPGPYNRKYLVPWSGFGVYRGSLAIAYPYRKHYFWAASEMVVINPTTGSYFASPFKIISDSRAGDSGLVETGDYALKAAYAYKIKLTFAAKPIELKPAIDLAFTSFTWQPNTTAQTNFSLDPKIGISFFPIKGQEFSLSTSATLYSLQSGEPAFRNYASRHIFFGAYWGLYF